MVEEKSRWQVGNREGLRQGRKEGLRKGHEEGVEQDREEGLHEGEARGREEGLPEGEARGREEGLREGEARAAIGLKLVSKPIVALVKGADAPFAGETCSRIHFGGALGARGAPYKQREGRPVQTGRRSRERQRILRLFEIRFGLREASL